MLPQCNNDAQRVQIKQNLDPFETDDNSKHQNYPEQHQTTTGPQAM